MFWLIYHVYFNSVKNNLNLKINLLKSVYNPYCKLYKIKWKFLLQSYNIK